MDNEPRRLVALQEGVESLGATEHGVLLDMISSAGVACAKNGNGYFCDLATLPEDLLQSIERYVSYSLENNRDLETHDRCMHDQLLLLQRIPASSPATAASSGQPKKTSSGRELSSRPAIDAIAHKGAKLAFIRRAGDAPCRRRCADDVIESPETPVFLGKRA